MGIAGMNQQAGDYQEYAGIVGAINGVVFGPIDVSLFRSGSLQVSGAGNAFFNVQAANAKSGPWQNVTTLSTSVASGGHTPLAPGDIYQFPVTYRYLQIACNWTSGVITGLMELYTETFSSATILAAASAITIGKVNFAGCLYAEVPSSAADTTVNVGSGVYFGSKVTVLGTAAPAIDDGTNTLDIIPASSAVGYNSVIPAGGVQYATSLVVKGNAANPSLVVYFQ